jgi:glycosyltransferase involved in cell wall biosynthesis
MKIAIVSDVLFPYISGGAEKKYYEIGKRLVSSGHEVTMYSQKWWEGKDEIEMEGMTVRAVAPAAPLFSSMGSRSITTSLKFALGAIKNGPTRSGEHYDIIECNEYPMIHTIPTLLQAKSKGIPAVLTVHEVWKNWWFKYSGAVAPIPIIIERLDKRLPAGIFVNSDFVKKRVESLGRDPSTIYIVHAGVDTAFYGGIKKRQKQFDCVYLGRLVIQKRADLLITALAKLKKERPDISACIIGTGPLEDEFRSLAKRLDLEDNITFTRRITDEQEVASYLLSSKMLVYPTAPEGGWSLSILEGYACGLPCVSVRSTDIGAGEEIVQNGVTGYLAENLDAGDIAEQIDKLLRDEDKRREMSSQALQFVKAYDWDAVAKRAEDAYRKVCGDS